MGQENNDINQQQLEKDGKESSRIKTKSLRKSPLDFKKYTKQIWLAGLGAFSRAEEEGNKLFDSLVKVGEELESKTTDITDQTVNKVAEKAKESVIESKDRVEKILDQGVNQSLNRIGLVSAKDVQRLENLILQLHQKVDLLLEENRSIKEQILGNKQK
ncbi:phasin family protein [Acinetobacter stercoris]|uniref:Poly(Hydroxyalcanoate) granule associated protein (Phasin) n=1 Tax=Acinetobacter stercoris TaxID=2126983 RepID=A0A2U3N0V0_9GAMM|nr:phasin family protein [Acinetobacter stercoris]SPL71307.1 Poly(hydroxyalcanoate) granule associated protein (phasin) [Acinetobacter stercoris]